MNSTTSQNRRGVTNVSRMSVGFFHVLGKMHIIIMDSLCGHRMLAGQYIDVAEVKEVENPAKECYCNAVGRSNHQLLFQGSSGIGPQFTNSAPLKVNKPRYWNYSSAPGVCQIHHRSDITCTESRYQQTNKNPLEVRKQGKIRNVGGGLI